MQTADIDTTSPRWNDFLHRLGEKTAEGIKKKIEAKDSLIAQSEQQHEAALAKLQAERAAALSVHERLSSLQIEVERVEDEIMLAKSTFAAFQGQLVSKDEDRANAWGDSAVIERFGGPNYLDIVNLRAALEDWPRVLEHLNRKLEVAQAALSNYERSL